jgi:signal transduction histidine kinase
MKPSPLRLRIALLSTLLSGAVMVMFGTAAWWTVSKQKSDALDARIRALGTRQPGWMFQDRDFRRLEENFEFIVTTPGDAAPYFLLVADGQGRVLHQTQDWPEGVAVDALVVPLADGKDGVDPIEEVDRPVWGRGQGPGRGRGPGGGGGGGQPMRFTKEPDFFTMAAAGRSWRVGRLGNDELTLVIGLSADATVAELRQLRNAASIALPAALLFIGLGGWFVAGRALRPLQRIAETASRVTARGLDQRVPDIGGDPEITRLVAMLNDMMNRLEASFHQATRFSADASHELKTPLAIMRGEIEQAIANASPDSPEQRTLNSLLEEAHRLGGIIRSLLLLSRADAGRLVTTLEPVDLTSLLHELVEDASASAEASAIRVESDITSGIRVSGDASLLRTAILNLLGNAIKHNLPEGMARVVLSEKDNAVYLEVANTAPPISPDEHEEIFERFRRGRAARDAAREGSGLGLSLAREIITAHGGSLDLAPDKELVRFVVTIPRTSVD